MIFSKKSNLFFKRLPATAGALACGLALVIAATALVSCGGGDEDDDNGGGGTWSVHISDTEGGAAITTATTGTTLYAVTTGADFRMSKWYKDGIEDSYTTADVFHTPTEEGSYTVKVTNTDGAEKTSAAVTVTAASGGTDNGGTDNGGTDNGGTDNGGGVGVGDTVTWYVQVKNVAGSGKTITGIKIETGTRGTVVTVDKTGLSIAPGSDSGTITVTGTTNDRGLSFKITVTTSDGDVVEPQLKDWLITRLAGSTDNRGETAVFYLQGTYLGFEGTSSDWA